MRRIIINFLSVLMVVSAAARSVSGKLYSGREMTNSSVRCISQDSYGYIWVGTEYGLNRFDGYRFQLYQHNSSDSTSLPQNEVVSMLCDSQGRLWVGTSGDLSCYDYYHNCFKRVLFPHGEHPRVQDIMETRRGDVYIETAGMGVFVLKRGAERFEQCEALSRLIGDHFSHALYEDAQGRLWADTRHRGFCCIDVSGSQPYEVGRFSLPEGQVLRFATDSRGRLLALFGKALLAYDAKRRCWADAGLPLQALAASTGFSTLAFSQRGDLYIGTTTKGVYVLRAGQGDYSLPGELLFRENHFNMDAASVSSVMEDRSGNLWVGCFRKGLVLLNKQDAAFRSWTFSSQKQPLSDVLISSVAPSPDGGAWCATWNAGLIRFDGSGTIVARPQVPQGTIKIYCDADGQYWLGADAGVYRFSPDGGARLAVPSEGWNNVICDSGDGRLFFTEFGRGFVSYDKLSGATRRYTASDSSSLGHLCNNWIGAMLVDRHHYLWIATSGGLSCMDLRNGSFRPFGWDALMTDTGASALCEDADGNIVIGSYAGLFLYDRQHRRVDRFPHSEALKDLMICAIERDAQGDLWVSTPMGIWQYASASRQFIPYLSGGGQVSHEYLLGLSLHNPDGTIGFAVDEGLTMFYPQSVRDGRQEIGRAVLTDVSINGRWASPLSDHIAVGYDENTFALGFSLLNYQDAEGVRYEYRLNGGGGQASLDGGNTFTFNRMPPGRYLIEVRAMYGGRFGAEVCRVVVDVSSPWYATLWARALWLLLLLAVGWALLSYYMRRKRMQMDDEKMKFLINATHDIRSPLTLIMSPLRKLKEMETDERKAGYLDVIDRNAQRMTQLVNQILDQRKIDQQKMQLHFQATDAVSLVGGVCRLFDYEAQQRGISFAFDHPDGPVILWLDRMNFDKVVSNLLSNAFKYTGDGGEIRVLLTSDAREAVLQVIDNGMGLKGEDSAGHLFDQYYQAANAVNLHMQGTGLGLSLCRSIVDMHGGRISAANRGDGQQGACFTVTIPVGNKHLSPETIVETDALPAPSVPAGGKKRAQRNVRIMIVDDDPEIPDYIQMELSAYYHFVVCPNGKEALKTLLTDEKRYDLVISDVMMPEMDGITLLKRIKENPQTSGIPVILLTSKTAVADRLEGLRKGADAYLSKPFEMEELHAQIDNLLDGVRRLRGVFTGAAAQKDKVENVEVKGNDDLLMERIMKSVNAHLSDSNFNVESLARDVGMSRAQLHRKMKEITGMSTGKFVRDMRMQQAARLIREGRVNVSQVAYSVGFSDQAHFSTVFKNYFGVTPSEYTEMRSDEESTNL